jgi:dipeptidyl-peptidase-4
LIKRKFENQGPKQGNWEVTSYYGFDENKQHFYQSTENGSPIELVIKYWIKRKKKDYLQKRNQYATLVLISILHQYLLVFTTDNLPLNEAKLENNCKLLKTMKLKQKLKGYDLPAKEFFVLKTEKETN